MRGNKNIGIALVLAIAGLGGSTSALAQTTMQANAKMAAACEISAPTVSLGEIPYKKGLSAFRKDADFHVEVKCSKGTAYRINDTQDYPWRPMTGQVSGVSNSLFYLIYIEQVNNNYWQGFGSIQQGDAFTVKGVGTGARFQHLLHISLDSMNSLPFPDNYSASTTLVLTF